MNEEFDGRELVIGGRTAVLQDRGLIIDQLKMEIYCGYLVGLRSW